MDLNNELDSAKNSLVTLKGDYAEERYIKLVNALKEVDNMNLLSVVNDTVWCNCDVVSNVCKLLSIVHSFADLILKNRIRKFLLRLRNHKLDENAMNRYSEWFQQSPEVAKEYVLYFIDMLSKDLGDKQLDVLACMFTGYVNKEFESEEQFHVLANINSGMFVKEYDMMVEILDKPVMLINDSRKDNYCYWIDRLRAKGLLNPYIAGSFASQKTVYAEVSDLGKKFCDYIQKVPEKNLLL